MSNGTLIYLIIVIFLIVAVYLEHAVKHRRIAFLFFGLITCVFVGLYFSGFSQGGYALCSRDLELGFVVTDMDKAEPIANASIEIMEDGYQENDRWKKIATLKTDETGTTRFFREMNSCEDIIRPFYKTVTLVDLTWAVVRIEREGYEPIEQMSLHSAPKTKNENEFNSAGKKLQRVEFMIPMRKLARK